MAKSPNKYATKTIAPAIIARDEELLSLLWESNEIIPGRGYIHVQKREPDKSTPGGLILPESAQEQQFPMFTVISVGAPMLLDNGTEVECPYTAGDRLIISSSMGVMLPVPHTEPLEYLVTMSAVVAKVQERAQ